MTEKILQSLEGVPQTLLMTLLVRARETRRPDGAIRDEKAVEIVNRLNADFSHLNMHRHDEIAVIVRMRKFDKFEGAQIRELFLCLRDHFPGCEVVCDAHKPFIISADNLHLALAKVKARMHWKVKNPHDVESWGADIHLIEEWNYYGDDEPLMKPFLWLRMIPGLAKSSGIYHYRLGK